MAPLTSNKAIEDAAIAWVMELERANGRQPQDTRYKGAPTDIESPPRLIEVKSVGTTTRGYDLLMEVRQVEEARRNPNFYVYVVENVRQGATPPSSRSGFLAVRGYSGCWSGRRSTGVIASPGQSPTR